MPRRWFSLLRALVLVGLYLAGTGLSLHLIHAPGEVALFWPSTGLAFAVVLRYGLRWWWAGASVWQCDTTNDRRSEEHTSELQSLMRISYAVFCLKKKKTK